MHTPVSAYLVPMFDDGFIPDPRWASATLGSFICIRCAGIHRNLGVHISFVRSATLDDWSTKHVKNMLKWGNDRVNEYYEARVPDNYYIPDENDDNAVVERWIRDKYEKQRFVADKLPPPSNQTEQLKSTEGKKKKKSKKSGSSSGKGEAKAESSKMTKSTEGEVEKVKTSKTSEKARSSKTSAPSKLRKNENDRVGAAESSSKSLLTSGKPDNGAHDDFDLLSCFDATPSTPASTHSENLAGQVRDMSISSGRGESSSAPDTADDFDLLGVATNNTGAPQNPDPFAAPVSNQPPNVPPTNVPPMYYPNAAAMNGYGQYPSGMGPPMMQRGQLS